MTIIFVDTIGTVIKLVNINKRLRKWSEITENIRSKIELVLL